MYNYQECRLVHWSRMQIRRRFQYGISAQQEYSRVCIDILFGYNENMKVYASCKSSFRYSSSFKLHDWVIINK